MKPIRILIIEDDRSLLADLVGHYRRVFSQHGYEPSIEQATTVAEARTLAKSARANAYDFVSLDINLGEKMFTGLDVLDTLKRFRSAWMVALLTGVETDASLDQTMGKERGEKLRKELRRDAYAKFPAERLLVVEKPPSGSPDAEAKKLLENRLEQIALVYEEISRLRYVFRPIEVSSMTRVPAKRGAKARRKFIQTTSRHWQIRFNCGELRTLPDMSGFLTLHYLLSRAPDQSVTPEEALVIEPKKERPKLETEAANDPDPVASWFEAQGITWHELSSEEQEKLMRAALSLKFERYCELREFEDDEDISPAEEEEFNRIIRELGPLSEFAETAYQRMKPDEPDTAESGPPGPVEMHQAGLHVGGANYDKLGTDRRGLDSPAAQLFRARMKRVKDCLRENGFADFAQHIEDYVQSTGARWSYNPPQGVEWTT